MNNFSLRDFEYQRLLSDYRAALEANNEVGKLNVDLQAQRDEAVDNANNHKALVGSLAKIKAETHTIDTWRGCYPSNWKGLIVPDAITHPAKYSSKLIRAIYEHIQAEGWIQPGDTVVDPFGGVALGALDAMRMGLRWRGVELEAKFAQIGNENIALWNSRFSTMPKWNPDSALINGDSRRLIEVLETVGTAAISSPPYAETTVTTNRQFKSKKNPKAPEAKDLRENGGSAYGETEGNLGSMPAGGFDQSISSPPYLPQSDRKKPWGSTMDKTLQDEDEKRGHKRDSSWRGSYSDNPANLGNPTGADQTEFWAAARVIVDQVYASLKPGGHACWVIKDFVKNKKIVPFCDQWRQLCEAAGFITLHEHHAELVRHRGTSYTLEGGEVKHVVSSKSFFRRVAEGKGSPQINYEVVYCMEKPR